jgi:hypothetical protein
MESRFFASLGKIAGIGGLALGVFLLIFQGVLKQNLLFSAGLSQDGAFYIIAALLLLTFGIAGIGIVAWLISRGNPDESVHPGSILLLVLLIILLFGGTIYLFKLGETGKEKIALPTPVSPAPTPLPYVTRSKKLIDGWDNYFVRVCDGNNKCAELIIVISRDMSWKLASYNQFEKNGVDVDFVRHIKTDGISHQLKSFETIVAVGAASYEKGDGDN